MSDLAAVGEAEYLAALLDLLPRGHAWPREPDSVQARFWSAIAARLAVHHQDALRLLDVEADPAAALELLADWERVAGLPDDCAGPLPTTDLRRHALVRQLSARGGQSAAYFIALASSAGFPGCAVEEFWPARCTGDCRQAIEAEADRFTWRLAVPAFTVTRALTCAGACDEPLRSWSIETLECPIRRRKPAHTTVLFAYREPILLTEEGDELRGEEDLPIEIERKEG